MEKNNSIEQILEIEKEKFDLGINFVGDKIQNFVKTAHSQQEIERFYFDMKMVLKSIGVEDKNLVLLKLIQLVKEKSKETLGFVDIFELKILELMEIDEGRREYNIY